MERVDPTTELGKLLVWCSQESATDLHTQADRRYSTRQDGKLERIAPEQFPVPSNDDIMRMLHQAFSNSIYERIEDRKSTRLNSSHVEISYAVFCLKKKKETTRNALRQ